MTVHAFCRIVALSLVAQWAGGCGLNAPASSTDKTPQPATRQVLKRFEYSQIHMGVRTRLVVYATDETAAVNACRAAFDRIARVDDVASDYRKDSELVRLGTTATTRPVKLSNDLWALITASQKLARLTDGAFDITAGPYIQLWRKARKEKRLPEPQAIAQASKSVGYRKLELDAAAQTIRLCAPGMKLDLGAVAKGYAGDVAIEVLRQHGITSAMFEAGGDIVVSDAPPDKEGWKISVADMGKDLPHVFALHNCAISTSGDTVQFVEIDGKHYSHVVDARSGIGLTTRRMATVIAPRGIDTDALSTVATLVDQPTLDRILAQYPEARAYVRTVENGSADSPRSREGAQKD